MKTYWLSGLCVSLLWLSGCDDASQPVTPDTPNQEDATQSQATSGESDSAAATSKPATPPQESTEDSANTAEDDADFFVIDVRSTEEFASGNVDGSINIPHTEIVEGIQSVTEDKSAKIYFY